MPRKNSISRWLIRVSLRGAPASKGNTTSRAMPIASHSTLRSTTWTRVKVTAAMRAWRSSRQAMVRWAR